MVIDANAGNSMSADVNQTGRRWSQNKHLELGLGEGNDQANGFSRKKSSGLKSDIIVKNGSIRHMIAIMALSAIVMANMNRQAYNQALVRMIRKPAKSSSAQVDLNTNATTLQLNEPNQTAPADVSSVQFDAEPSSTSVYGEPIEPLLSELTDSNDQSENEVDEIVKDLNQHEPEEDQDGFDWTGSQIGTLQAGFSYGYTIFMIPGGRLSEIYGSKWVIFVSGFGSALCSMLTPFIASQSFALLVASRVFMGICQTGVSPALYAFCTRWLPPDESSVYLPLIKVGVMIGFMLGSLINGFLPWRMMFYVVGTVGFAWSLMWACFATSEPKDQRFLTKKELAYIDHCLEQQRLKELPRGASTAKKDKSSSAPWFGILTNPVVLAFTFTKFTVKLSTDTQTMQLPMYLRNVFQVADSFNSVLNSANFAIQACFTGLVAYVAKEMVSRKPFGMNKTGVRILFQGINNFGMGLGYLLISFNMGSLELVCCAVMLLSITSMFGSGGEAVLPVDLTTEYAASIMAIANSLANTSGIVMPRMVSQILANDLTSPERWNLVWRSVSAIMICGGLVFSTFVKAKVQDFAGEGKKNDAVTSNTTGKGDKSARSLQAVVDIDSDNQVEWTTRL